MTALRCTRLLLLVAVLLYPAKLFSQTAASALTDTALRVNGSLLTNKKHWENMAATQSPANVAKAIREFNQFPQAPKTGLWTLYYLKVNDTLKVPYLVYIPHKYNPAKKTPLYVYLHGGISKPGFARPEQVVGSLNKVLGRPISQNAFIIYPFGRQSFNWIFHQQAFEAILAQVSEIKALYNIDDNKVYIGGHSDGARGAFWFALNNSSTFAACFGICYEPVLFGVNTPLVNLRNTGFYGVSAVNDELFSNRQVNQMVKQMQGIGANVRNYNIQGGHGLPFTHPDSVSFLYNNLISQTRKPFPKHIIYETDNVKNGRYAWISISTLDTAQKTKNWHKKHNFTITSAITGKDEVLNLNPSKSGLVDATLKDNVLTLKTSCVAQLTFYALDGMLDMNKPLIIRLNDNPPYEVVLKPDSNLMVHEFLQTKDRVSVVSAKLTIAVN